MWICTKFGFFSVVQKAPDEFHVRARVRKDLANLKKAAHLSAKIHRSEPADYRYRMVLHVGAWRIAAATLIDSVDYPNFKSMVAKSPDQAEKLTTYSDFHHDMEQLQARTEEAKRRKPKPGEPFQVIEGVEDPAETHARRMRRMFPGIENATD